MTEPAASRYLLFAADTARGLRLARDGDAPLVGMVEAGHGVRLSGDLPLIEDMDGSLRSCDAARLEGIIKLAHAGDAVVMRFLFQSWVRDRVWARVVRRLALGGLNAAEWKLVVSDDALVLRHARDGVVADHSESGWWLVVDPDRAADIGNRLTSSIPRLSAA